MRARDVDAGNLVRSESHLRPDLENCIDRAVIAATAGIRFDSSPADPKIVAEICKPASSSRNHDWGRARESNHPNPPP